MYYLSLLLNWQVVFAHILKVILSSTNTSVACDVPVVQRNSLDCIDTVVKLIASSEHNTKATASKTRLLMKVGQVSRQHSISSNVSKT